MIPEDLHIKDYQIHLPALGEGSYGRVYRATYRGISERALKIFRSGTVDLSTMARELEKLSSVAEHTGIVTLHDFDLLADPPYYAMGLHADQRPDGSWETRALERLCGHVDQREAWRLLRDIADALAYLHRNHIVHCDIKPSNILLTDETPYRVKICDFGQSRGNALEGFLPAGTPIYASPEQLRHPRDSAEGKGYRWDVYSFGVVAYKLFTGELPRLQHLVGGERKSFDPEATISESGLDPTASEDTKNIDGERLARQIEAEEEIKWPPGLSIPHDRKELVERCLALDPAERFADMREVFSAMQGADQQRVVRRGRRLNTLFASLLVLAIWATGFAFMQLQRAHEASESATRAREQAEQLVFFIVNKLNREELSGKGLDELYDHIADNAETYLENLPKTQGSTTLMRISANTASMRAKQALEAGDLDLALAKFRNAYEIRSQLADSVSDLPELGWLASNDLMEIGEILARQGKLKEALATFDEALAWRTRDADLAKPQPQPQLRRLIETLAAIASVHEQSRAPAKAIAILQRAVDLHQITASAADADADASLKQDLFPLLSHIGRLQFAAANLDAAEQAYQQLLDAASSPAPPGMPRGESEAASRAEALHALGQIAKARGDSEAALARFREEVRERELLLEMKPYDPAAKIGLADACHAIAFSLDATQPAQRSVALYHLERAVSLLGRLPLDLKQQPSIQAKMLAFQEKISEILEMEE